MIVKIVYTVYDVVHKCFLCRDMTWTFDLDDGDILFEANHDLVLAYVESKNEIVLPVTLTVVLP